jgi:hypothetical protein
MTKILITGFMHSGTTMLMSLLRAHPQVGWIEFEEGYIEFDKPKEWVLMMASKSVSDLSEKAWGDKIPWGNRKKDINAERPIEFTKKWMKYFGKKARVLHIIRHPIDVALSGGGKTPSEDTLKQIFSSIPKYIDFINNNSRIATIVYEDLVTEPKKYLSKIFDFLALKTNDKIVNKVINTELKFGKINSDRAFAYKRKGLKSTVDYNDFLKHIKERL